MTESTLVIHRSKKKMALAFLFAIGFVALGAFMAKDDYVEHGAGGFGVFMGILCVLFFGLCAVIGLFKVFDRRPAVEFSSDGLRVPDIAVEPIGWLDILAVRLVTYRRQPFIELLRSQSAEQSLPFTRTVRYTRAANRGLGFHGVCLSGVGLDRSPSTIVTMIGEWAEKAQATAPAQ